MPTPNVGLTDTVALGGWRGDGTRESQETGYLGVARVSNAYRVALLRGPLW